MASTAFIAFDSDSWTYIAEKFPESSRLPPQVLVKKMFECGLCDRYDALCPTGKQTLRLWTLDHLCACHVCVTPMTPQGSLLKCSACKSARYCSKDCQKSDWLNHKQVCNVMSFRLVSIPDSLVLDSLDSGKTLIR